MIASVSILAALVAMLGWGFGDFLIQKATRKLGDVETLAWIGLLGSLGLLPFVWNDLALVLQRSNFIILLILGVIVFIVALINFEALKRGKLSVVEVLFELELPLTVILGMIFLKEHVNFLQVLLMLLIFVGIILIAAKPGEIKKRHFFEKGAVLALVTAIGYGLINFLTAVGAKEISPILTIWFPWVVFTGICIFYLLYHGRLKTASRHIRTYTWLIVGMGILDTLAWIFFAIAVEKKELAVTIAITESYPAISLLLGITINHEKISKLQIVGASITIVGSFLIGLTS
ncbi:MAG: DMT family transporter [Candidatus Doudnabacteria bacterium]